MCGHGFDVYCTVPVRQCMACHACVLGTIRTVLAQIAGQEKKRKPANSCAEKPAWIVESCLLKKEMVGTVDGNRVPVKENTRARMPGRAKNLLCR